MSDRQRAALMATAIGPHAILTVAAFAMGYPTLAYWSIAVGVAVFVLFKWVKAREAKHGRDPH